MDDSVKQAMQKWPNVPHCYGWLALDARGHWRMRDERAQALNLPGDRIAHDALLAFINRNYAHDEQGRWYFQNGPQRVYVDLELTPFIAHTDAEGSFVLQDGRAIASLAEVCLSGAGQFFLVGDFGVAALDDRDTGQALDLLVAGGAMPDEGMLLDWLAGSSSKPLQLRWRDQTLPVRRIDATTLAREFGFIAKPRAE